MAVEGERVKVEEKVMRKNRLIQTAKSKQEEGANLSYIVSNRSLRSIQQSPEVATISGK